MALATPAQYAEILSRTAEVSDPAVRSAIGSQLEAVSEYLERELDREFEPVDSDNPDAATAREYPAALGCFLTVHDCRAAPTAVAIDTKGDGVYNVDLQAGDWRVRPLNAARRRPPRPFERLELIPSERASTWGAYTVKVTAAWGWPAVPAAIVQLTCQLVGILRNTSPLATNRITDVGTVIGASKEAKNLIHQLGNAYRRKPEDPQVQPSTWFA